MERVYKVGAAVKFVDAYGQVHDALITRWWDGSDSGMKIESYTSQYGDPGCNVVYVTSDERKEDSYGRQTERMTSVVHKSKQMPTPGMYYCWADEI